MLWQPHSFLFGDPIDSKHPSISLESDNKSLWVYSFFTSLSFLAVRHALIDLFLFNFCLLFVLCFLFFCFGISCTFLMKGIVKSNIHPCFLSCSYHFCQNYFSALRWKSHLPWIIFNFYFRVLVALWFRRGIECYALHLALILNGWKDSFFLPFPVTWSFVVPGLSVHAIWFSLDFMAIDRLIFQICDTMRCRFSISAFLIWNMFM